MSYCLAEACGTPASFAHLREAPPPSSLAGVLPPGLSSALLAPAALLPLLDGGGGGLEALPAPEAATPDAVLLLPLFEGGGGGLEALLAPEAAAPDAPEFPPLLPPPLPPPAAPLLDAPDDPDEGTRFVGVVLMLPAELAAAAAADALPPVQHSTFCPFAGIVAHDRSSADFHKQGQA